MERRGYFLGYSQPSFYERAENFQQKVSNNKSSVGIIMADGVYILSGIRTLTLD